MLIHMYEPHSSGVRIIEGLRAKRAYIAFLANFHFLQDRANFWQTDLF